MDLLKNKLAKAYEQLEIAKKKLTQVNYWENAEPGLYEKIGDAKATIYITKQEINDYYREYLPDPPKLVRSDARIFQPTINDYLDQTDLVERKEEEKKENDSVNIDQIDVKRWINKK